MNQFMATAVAEKLSVLETVDFFEQRRGRADYTTFERVLDRDGGQPPTPGDERG